MTPQTKISVAEFVLLIVIFGSLNTISASSDTHARDRLVLMLGEESLGKWRDKISEEALAPVPSSDGMLILAAKRTNRPDILRGLKHYQGGWDITNRHYWASVGFTGFAGFFVAVVWFISFGLALVAHHCCGWRINIKGIGSRRAQRICLIMLILFTCAAAVGCILLSVGQAEFHDEVLHTMKYVVNQSDFIVQTLRNVTEYLALAKTINVAQIFIPSDALNDVDKLNVDLNSAADTLSVKMSDNSGKLRKLSNTVRSALIAVAVVMIIVAILGFLLSVLGHKHAIYIFVIGGWLLVAAMFVLCGLFFIINNAISDTCVAMEEWVDHPHSETALSDILPCVDQRTTNQTLIQSKKVINDIVTVVNTFIYTYANSYPSPAAQGPQGPQYYNQSGPPMPPLCYPFDQQLQDRQCGTQEVTFTNASLVWQNYTCMVSEAGLCTTTGRVTPDIYKQLVAAVNESYALEYYTPVLLSLEDCKFVRATFEKIASSYCPPLEHHLKMVNAGLSLIAVGVMLCLVLWILYANRPQREEAFVKSCLPIKGSGCGWRRFNSISNENILSPNIEIRN